MIGTIIGIIMLIGGITLYHTFAMYENNKTYNVIKGKVPDFSVSNGDIILAITMNNKKISGFTFPNKDENYKVNQVTCEDGVTADFDVTVWGLINIQNPNQANMIKCTIDFKGWEYEYTGEEQKFTAPLDGNYKIELWGAQGGMAFCNGYSCNAGGKGSYTTGEIELHVNDTFYIYVGGAGSNAVKGKNVAGGYNGGGLGTWDRSDDDASAGGGGATDMRLVNGDWKNFDSLKSRIMVAAGGGGASGYSGYINVGPGGDGGGLSSPKLFSNTTPANQTSGYAFGYGQDGAGGGVGGAGVAGGGSGYYGGETRDVSLESCGIGGSSFISGHPGCNAIKQESTEGNIVHTGDSTHYSGFVFTNTDMKAGNEIMPMHDGIENTMTGNTGNGYAKITYLGK